jgi:arylsulfatase A-like enzyme
MPSKPQTAPPKNYKSSRTSKSVLIIFIAFIITLVILSLIFLRGLHTSAPIKNFVIIVIDTLRADKLSCYGNPVDLTPEIDSFAQNAVRFDQVFSHAPWTLPSVASIFTSQYPFKHTAGGQIKTFYLLPDKAVTIAEVLHNAGFVTGAIINVLYLTEKFGMTQGFESVDSRIPVNNLASRRAEETTNAALNWLDQHKDERFFLFVHYFDPHLIYEPPEPFRRRFADARERQGNDFIFGTGKEVFALRKGEIKLDCDTVRRLEKLYNGEIAYTDYEVGRLLKGLSSQGLDENTAVIITSDHGEEFCDHGGFEHGHTLYNELLHVPLIIRIPGSNNRRADATGISINTIVRHIDIAPTICELAGVEPNGSFLGNSLTGLINGKKEPNRPVLSEGNMWGPSGIAWLKDGFKLIRSSPQTRWQLFDLRTDKGEQNNIAEKQPKICAEMIRDSKAVFESISKDTSAGSPPELSQEDLRQLRTLGYVE